MRKPIDYRKAQLLWVMVHDPGDPPYGYTHLELSRAIKLKKSPWTMKILHELMRDGYVKCRPYGLQLRNGLLVHAYYVPIEQREAAREYADNVFDYHSEIELLRVERGNRPSTGPKPVDVWPDRW